MSSLMVTRISIILILSCWLSLQDHSSIKRPWSFSVSRSVLTRLYLTRYDFQDQGRAQLLARYAAGLRTRISPELLLAHERMHLMHLFTPSGLHFSALFLWLLPLYWRYKKTKNKWLLIPLIALSLAPWSLEGYFSLKRVGLLKCAFLFKTMSGLRISAFTLFLTIFFLDYLWGTYQFSPRSFQLSFLFIGLLFSCIGKPKIFLFAVLMLGQLLVSFTTQSAFYPLGYFFGFFYTMFFSLIFPLLLMSFWLSPYLPFTPFEGILALLEQILLVGSRLSLIGPTTHPGPVLIFGVLAWLVLSPLKRILARIILIMSLSLDPSPLFSILEMKKKSPPRFTQLQSVQAVRPRWVKAGVNYRNEKSQRCNARLFSGHRWLEACR
jgi:hypothetical protein